MADIDEDLHETVRSIVDELEAAASGSLYKIDGNYEVIDDLDEWRQRQYDEKAGRFRGEHPENSLDTEAYGSYEEWMEDEIGTVDDIDEPDRVSLGEYIDRQSLGDVRFEVDSGKTLLGGKILFCYGGPNVWVEDDGVRGYWGSSRVEMSLDPDTRSALWDWFEEQWDMVKG